jgi:hypothetical protein
VLTPTGQIGGPSASAAVGDAARFTLTGVVPGTYRAAVISPDGWRPKSFEVLGRDALDFLLTLEPNRSLPDATVTLTMRRSTLGGTLVDLSGQPTSAYTIVVFPEDATYWTPQSRRIQATRPATDGRFTFANLPAGTYRLVAVDDLEDGRWFDPTVLRQLTGAAMSVTIGDGGNHTQDIRVTR